MMFEIFLAHEGHNSSIDLGQLHFAFLHFPIALVTMTLLSEILYTWTRNILYEYASFFMLMAAACLVLPTLIFGQILGNNLSESYVGISTVLYPWHQIFGYATTFLVIITALLRLKERDFLYLSFLVLSFLSMSISGFLGGALSFGVGI